MGEAKRKKEYRIQKAVNGLLIPMLDIPKLYGMLGALIVSGADDAQLKQEAHDFIYGKVTESPSGLSAK
jgi:hypothetical protein